MRARSRGSLVYRAFCQIDCERVPDAKALIRLAHLLGPETLKPALERLVQLAHQRGVTRGHRLRVDTTVVETNSHYPTDSSLLTDGVRVLTRTMKRLQGRLDPAGLRVRDRTRSVAKRVFEIVQRSRAAGRGSAATEATRKARVTTLYRQVMAITRAVVRQAEAVSHQALRSRQKLVKMLRRQLEATTGLVRRVLGQTRARVLKGDTHYSDKVLSLFEPHTEVIRKGKAANPTGFGQVAKIQEADGQLITDYQVCAPRVRDHALWVPALERHIALFGRPPRLAVADAAFASTANERAAAHLGVKRVALPRRGRPPRVHRPPPRWYRRALRWRTGSEARISALTVSVGRDSAAVDTGVLTAWSDGLGWESSRITSAPSLERDHAPCDRCGEWRLPGEART